MNTQDINPQTRQAALHVLAAVGFIALIGSGMWLAVYSTRYVPAVVGRVGAAAVFLGSVFTPAEEPSLSVVPTPVASTTIPFGEAASSTSAISTPVPTTPKPVQPAAGERTTNTYPMGGTTAVVTSLPNGLPDFVVTIDAVGYLATTSAESFVASSTVPAQSRPAVTFTVKNIGTKVTGQWRFSASIPTQTAYVYQSDPQQPLNPGDSIKYTLGFDQANKGADRMISITANFDHAVAESNPDNNSASAQVTLLGS